MKVAIFGLGYVGLPLAVLCAKRGNSVAGIDINKRIVDLTNKGHSHIADPVLENSLSELKGKIRASAEPDAAAGADVAVVCVPTPVDRRKRPDLTAVCSASAAIAKNLRRGQLVIVESTVYPGTIEEVVQPILEKSGLKAGKDFDLAHCPERIDPGNRQWTLEKIPRVLGALTAEGAKRTKAFYDSILDAKVTVLGSIMAAEAVKVTENTFRDVNIAFVNELAMCFDRLGIDITEVIRGASTKPFGYMPFYPGPGVGGHCIAVDPLYLIQRAEQKGFEHRFLRLARLINDSMPNYVVKTVLSAVKKAGIPRKKTRIAVLGLAYKAGVGDTRESPALEIVRELKKRHLAVVAYDPLVKGMSNATSLGEALSWANCIVLATAHREFIDALTPEFLRSRGIRAVIDARNSLDKQGIISKGIIYKGVGR